MEPYGPDIEDGPFFNTAKKSVNGKYVICKCHRCSTSKGAELTRREPVTETSLKQPKSDSKILPLKTTEEKVKSEAEVFSDILSGMEKLGIKDSSAVEETSQSDKLTQEDPTQGQPRLQNYDDYDAQMRLEMDEAIKDMEEAIKEDDWLAAEDRLLESVGAGPLSQEELQQMACAPGGTTFHCFGAREDILKIVRNNM